MALAPGTILGRYEIKSLLGQGGMGAVYRASDKSLGRDVALKVLDPAVAVDPERVHRFLQEARAASALNHPNIIAIHEAGESGATRFIATELVEGRTLREMLEEGPLPLTQALDIAAQVASALAAAHVAGIVHRDIKPENIMVRPDGYAKVLDFGLAKLTDTSASGASPALDPAATMLQTTAGVIMGTVAYMSPEQARALKVDVRTDCYSLGAVLFEMLSGRQPFKGATGTDVMVAILERDAPLDLLKREGLPSQLVWVLAKALEKNPDLRHQNAADLRVDLDRLKRDIATGASYGDQGAQADRPSAILRDVLDSDADAVRMYGLSRATMVVAAIGLALMFALPFLYRQTLGAEQSAPLPEAAAEIRGRDVAAALGRPVDGREVEASLGRSTIRLEAVRDLGPEEARRVVRAVIDQAGAVSLSRRLEREQTAGALPGIAGVVAWLKQGSPLRLHGAEQMAAGHFRSPAAAGSLVAGLAGGAALAAVSLAHTAGALGLAGYAPSVTRELGVASPATYASMLGWLAGSTGVALGVAVLYELPARLMRRPAAILALLTVIMGVLTSGSQPVWASTLMSAALAAIVMAVYAWRGFGAVAVSVWVLFLLLDLIAGRSMGGPLAGPRATMLLVAVMALIALAVWGYAGERMKAGAANLSSKSGIR